VGRITGSKNSLLSARIRGAGLAQIAVRPYPTLDSGYWQVSAGGGTRPLWSRDGSEIFYADAGGFLTAVAVEPRGDALSIGKPEVVVETKLDNLVYRTFDVSPDGERFLMIKPAAPEADADVGQIVLVEN
jgi:hypothetical protein